MKNYLCILLLIICCVCISVLYSLHLYYSGPSIRQTYALPLVEETDTLNIAYIGDSWAYLHKDHACLIGEIIENAMHKSVKIYSYGIPGLTSKEIYENIFDNEDLKTFLVTRNYKFCYISAGINDANLKMSTLYYVQSIDYIIQFLLENNIRPIIQGIPDFDILSTYYKQRMIKRLVYRLSSQITNSPIDCRQKYRKALNDLIKIKKYKDVSIISYKSWNNNYTKDLKTLYKEDRMHLNDKGYEKLDSVIAAEIIQICNSN